MTTQLNTANVSSQCVSIKTPTILLPSVVPNLPHIKIIHTAIALTCVGNNATTPLEMTDIETPPSTIKPMKDVRVSVGSESHSIESPHAPETNKQKAGKSFMSNTR